MESMLEALEKLILRRRWLMAEIEKFEEKWYEWQRIL